MNPTENAEPKQGCKEEVGRDAVYREIYTEMRRFRGYQFSSSMWYTVLLATTLGFLISAQGNDPKGVGQFLREHAGIGWAIGIVSTIIALTSCFLIKYTDFRYKEQRVWTTEHLEPSWNDFQPDKK